LFHNKDDIREISFDHDIASTNIFGDEVTGYHCLCVIEKMAMVNSDYKIPKMYVHSANPVGRMRMEKVIRRLEKWDAEDQEQAVAD